MILGFLPGLSSAQPIPLDATEFQVNSYTTDMQGLSDVVRGPDGGFVVVWTSVGSPGSDTSGESIQGQRYDAQGAPLGAQFQINTYTTGDQLWPRVASDSEGNFIVAWASFGSFGDDSSLTSVQARRYRADGTPLDPAEFQVNTYTTDYQQTGSVASDAQGNFVVVWNSNGSLGSDSSNFSVQARRYRAGAEPLDAAEFQVNTYTTDFQWFSEVAARPNGDFVVAWVSYGSFGSDHSAESTQARRFTAGGTALDAQEFQVNSFTPGPQHHPALAMIPSGDFVVAWQSDYGNGVGTDPFLTIQARRFAADGTPKDPMEFQVNEYTPNGQIWPRVAANEEGDFTVAWTSVGSWGIDDDGSSNQARRFRAGGTPVDPAEWQVNVFTPNNQITESVAASAEGDFVISWYSSGGFGNDPDTSVQARRFGRPTIQVTSTSGGIGGPGCTLRDAITAANTNLPVGDCAAGNEGANLDLPAGSTVALTEPDNGSNALPLIERPVTIRGHGARIERDPGLACPVGPEFRLLEVPNGGVLTLEDVSVANGCLSTGSGAGVLATGGSVVLRKASIEGNEAGSDGGGLAVLGGNLFAFDSTVRGNLAGGAGGGLAVSGDPGWLMLDRATVSGNVAASGGGLALSSAAPALVRNATFSGNEATASGGGVELAGFSPSLTLDFSTIVGNAAPSGAGVLVGSGVLTIHGSLVGEGAGGAGCASGAGSMVASGANLDTDGSCAALAGGNVTTVASLGLGQLADNGGWVRTHLPLAGSPVLDAAPACETASGAPLFEDARGHSRPTDDDGNGTPACDLGAVEPGMIFLDGFESGDTGRWSLAVP